MEKICPVQFLPSSVKALKTMLDLFIGEGNACIGEVRAAAGVRWAAPSPGMAALFGSLHAAALHHQQEVPRQVL